MYRKKCVIEYRDITGTKGDSRRVALRYEEPKQLRSDFAAFSPFSLNEHSGEGKINVDGSSSETR